MKIDEVEWTKKMLEVYSSIIDGVQKLIENDKNATAKDVLKMLNIGNKFIKMIQEEFGEEK